MGKMKELSDDSHIDYSTREWQYDYLDGKSASEWCEWGKRLNWLYGDES